MIAEQLHPPSAFTHGWLSHQRINDPAQPVHPALLCLHQLLRKPDQGALELGAPRRSTGSPDPGDFQPLNRGSLPSSGSPRGSRRPHPTPRVATCVELSGTGILPTTSSKFLCYPDASVSNAFLCIINCFSLAENHFSWLSL